MSSSFQKRKFKKPWKLINGGATFIPNFSNCFHKFYKNCMYIHATQSIFASISIANELWTCSINLKCYIARARCSRSSWATFKYVHTRIIINYLFQLQNMYSGLCNRRRTGNKHSGIFCCFSCQISMSSSFQKRKFKNFENW